MPFFDFHCHPGLKPQFSDPANKPSPWDYIDAKLSLARDIKLRINSLFNEVLNSQSNLQMLLDNDVRLVGLILHAPEKNIGKALGEKKIVNRGSVNLIDKTQLDYLALGTHYFELINEELRWLKAAPAPVDGRSLKVLTKAADFDEADTTKVFGAIIVEGLHCFFNDRDALDAKEKFTENFNCFTTENAVVAINICHMQQNPFCNHAHGIQFFNPAYFFPTQMGITPWGREVIQMMIDKKILTDIKHMSLIARLDLYSWFQDDNDTTKYIQPLICTHAGTTGISIKDRAKFLLHPPASKGTVYEVSYLKPRSRHFEDTYHNCSSINLYDEDIENIFLSGGIIGLSFDQRILGFADESVLPETNEPHDVEYISQLEAVSFLGPDPANLLVWPDDDGVWAAEDFAELSPADFPIAHRRFLVNNIIHLLWVAGKPGGVGFQQAAKQICLGTDFDGLINAIDCCKTTEGLASLRDDMRGDLEEGLEKIGASGAINVDILLDNIFYKNGKNFILGRLKILRGS